MTVPMHRSLLDKETLVERAHIVAMIAEQLRHQDAWRAEGNIVRRRTAKRIAFAHWLAECGEIGGGVPVTAPASLRLDPAAYPPPHGPEHLDCDPCAEMRDRIGYLHAGEKRAPWPSTLTEAADAVRGAVWPELGEPRGY